MLLREIGRHFQSPRCKSMAWPARIRSWQHWLHQMQTSQRNASERKHDSKKIIQQLKSSCRSVHTKLACTCRSCLNLCGCVVPHHCSTPPSQHYSGAPATLSAKLLYLMLTPHTTCTLFMHADSARSCIIQCHQLLSTHREWRPLPHSEWCRTVRPTSYRGFQATGAGASEAASGRAGGPQAVAAGGCAPLQGPAVGGTQPLPGPREQAG